MKILAQRPIHISAVATVLLITKIFTERERERERDSVNSNGSFDLSECSYQHTGGGGGGGCMFNCMYKRTVHKRYGISHVMKQSWLKFCVISWWYPPFLFVH